MKSAAHQFQKYPVQELNVDALLTISSTYGDNVTHIKVDYISL